MKCVVPVSFRSNSSGFTLIELMIAVAIVGVLAAIAYPSYIEYVKKGRRAELMVQMWKKWQFMERYYTENRKYPSTNLKENVPPGASDTKRSYVLWSQDPSDTAFLIRSSGDGPMLGDKCGYPGLDNFGRIIEVRFYNQVVFQSEEAAIEYCWR